MPFILNHILYLIKNMTLQDQLDVFFVAILFFFFFYFIIEYRVWPLIFLLVGGFFIYYLSKILNLGLSQQLMRYFFSFGILIIMIIFQKEIRRFVLNLKILPVKSSLIKEREIIHQILETLDYFSKTRIGAIFVFKGKEKLRHLIHGGIPLNSEINSKILISIFQKNSPLHDGAVIIDKDKILLAAVHLPLAESYSSSKLGTRHRASVGITEESDAFSIVVSEETGKISLAERKKLILDVDKEFIEKKLENYYFGAEWGKSFFGRFFHLKSLISSLIFSILLSLSIWIANNYNTALIQKIIEIPIEFRNLNENLMISKVNSPKVSIMLMGSEKDFKLLNLEGKKAIIDLKEYKKGIHSLKIEKNNLNLPPNFEILKIEPKILQFQIIEKPTSSESW